MLSAAVRLAMLVSCCCCSSLLAAAVGNDSAGPVEACSRTRVRLAGGYGPSDGLVLVQDVAENWHRLCFMLSSAATDLTRLLRNAEVMCRSAGLGTGAIKASLILHDRMHEKTKTDYSHYITLWALECKGDESTLSDCRPIGFQFKNPTRIAHANKRCWYSVACSEDRNFTVTIREPETLEHVLPQNTTVMSAKSGAVQVTSFGLSGGVCASSSDLINIAWIAKVGCRQSGYRNGIGVRLMNRTNTRSCLMHNTICSGTETTLADCLHESVWGDLVSERSRFTIGEEPSYGIPVQALCGEVAETVDVRLIRNLSADGQNQLVFFKVGDLLLPVINRASPDTCLTICSRVTGDRDATARCNTQNGRDVLEARLKEARYRAGAYVYYAELHCRPEHMELAQCAYGITVVPASEPNAMAYEQLVVRCDSSKPKDGASTNTSPTVRLLDGGRTALQLGCAQVFVEGVWRSLASSEGASRTTDVARVVCRNLQVPEASSTTTVIYATHGDECPSAEVLGSCGSHNYLSPDECSYAAVSPGRSRPSLFVACGTNSSFGLSLDKGFGNENGAVKVTQGGLSGYIAVTEWTDAAASVACREMGMNSAKARAIVKYFPHDRKRILMLRVSGCNGSETSLQHCTNYVWSTLRELEDDGERNGDGLGGGGGDNGGTYVAGVVCGGGHIRLLTTQLRQAAAPAHLIPAVQWSGGLGNSNEMTYFCLSNHTYHYINGHDYGHLALCKQAGVNRVHKASEYKWRANNGTLSTSSKAFKNLACGSLDAALEECSYETLVDADSCPIPPDIWSPVAAIKCESQPVATKVRLVGGSSRFEGHVEVLYNGEWGAICDDGFNDYAATLICREIFGQQSSGYAVQGSRFATRNEKFLIDGLYCIRGEHQKFLDCDRNDWGDHDCTACEQAGVVCRQIQYLAQPIATVEVTAEGYRASCFAEAHPPAQYQWITNGTQRVVAGSVIAITTNGHANGLSYLCVAYNEAGEKSVEIHVAPIFGFAVASYEQNHCAKPTGLIAAVCLLASLCVVTALYALYLHRLLKNVSSGKGSPIVNKFIAYDNPTFH